MLESINNQQTYSTLYAHQSYSLEAFSLRTTTENGQKENVLDTVSIQGESTVAVTYDSAMTLQGNEGSKYSMLQSLVSNLLQEQGIDTQIMVGDTQVDLTTISQEEARELTAEDGYFGVEQTSDRIFQFAVGIAGGDPGRLDAIKEGIDKGFEEALEAFGGWLPEISYDTYDSVMEKLDNWATDALQ